MQRVGEFEKVSFEQFRDAMKDEFYRGQELPPAIEDDLKKMWEEIALPSRATTGSAGYDFKAPFTFEMRPGETMKIKENQTVSDDELPQTAKCIAMAALKYGDLSNMPTKDYVFDLDRFSSFEGNTGPYILYTIVRIKSILAKYGKPVSPAQLLSACSAEQKQLMLVLSRMADALWSAYRDSAPNTICAYIYELATAANKFYHDVKILTEPDPARQASYAALIDLTRGVLETCIDLLGFSAPERM